jgi:hypothetical protein
MIFRKNLPGWERTMRVLLGALMIGYGLVGLPAGPLRYAIAAGGVIAILTGFFASVRCAPWSAASCRRGNSSSGTLSKGHFAEFSRRLPRAMQCCRKLGKRVAKVSRNDLGIPAR